MLPRSTPTSTHRTAIEQGVRQGEPNVSIIFVLEFFSFVMRGCDDSQLNGALITSKCVWRQCLV